MKSKSLTSFSRWLVVNAKVLQESNIDINGIQTAANSEALFISLLQVKVKIHISPNERCEIDTKRTAKIIFERN